MIETKNTEFKENMNYSSFREFLYNHRIRNDDDKPITHTRIGDIKNGIYGGKYHISDDKLSLFNKLYADHINNGNAEYLTEVQHNDNKRPVVVDLDFRYDKSVKTRQHNGEHIDDFVGLYVDTFIKCYDLRNTIIYAYVFHKDDVNCLEDKTKDGSHMVFNIAMDTPSQLILRDKVKPDIIECIKGLNITNSIDDVLDIGITKGNTNWQLYGSQKPNNQPYKITHTYECVINDDYDVDINIIPNNFDIIDVLNKCSVRNTNYKTYEMLPEFQKEYRAYTQQKPKPITQHATQEFNDGFDYQYISNDAELKKVIENMDCPKIIEIINALPTKYSDDYHTWYDAGMCLKCQSGIDGINYFPLWLYFSSLSDKFDYGLVPDFYKLFNGFLTYDECQIKFENGGKTIATMLDWLKSDCPDKFKEICKKYNIKQNNNIIQRISNASVCDIFMEKFGDNFIYTNGEIYYWNGNIWEDKPALSRISSYIKNEIYNDLHSQITSNSEAYGEGLSSILTQIAKLTDWTFRDKTCKDIRDALILKQTDEITFNFEDSQKYNIHFRNGVLMLDKIDNYDNIMETAFRKREKTDYMTFYNDYDFIKPQKSTIVNIYKLYRQIQPDEETFNYFMNFLAYCLTGDTQSQKCEFDIGYTASNGKSTHLKIHNEAMDFYTSKLPKNTFDEGFTKAHKYLIKLFDKPVRLSYMEELKTTKLDAELFKDFVDNNPLNIEKMYGTSILRKTQTKLKACSNHDINIKSDRGVLRRGLKVDFKSQFVKKEDVNPSKHKYQIDENLTDKFKTNEYKSGYICALIPYIKNYFKHGLIVPKKISNAFENMIDEYDDLKIWLDKNIEDCDEELEPKQRISKKELLDRLEYAGLKNGWRSILPKMKMMGYEYDRNLSCGIERHFNGGTENIKRIRGGFTGCKWILN